MKHCFIFCHGLGFDTNFWNNLHPYFAKESCIYLDLGYFGNEDLHVPVDPSLHFIGIGHSLGFRKLLSLPINFSKLIGIQGFTNFLGSDPILHTTRQNDLNILRQNFNRSPALTLQNFYKRCGVPFEKNKLKYLNIDKLQTDLETLSYIIPHSFTQSTLIIGTEDDIIVPMKLINDNFSNQPNVYVTSLNHGRHSLGYTQIPIIHQIIMDFLKENA